ncbi:hypothetical protein SHAM105786_17110 [Shewanella amazonensis]
MMIFERFESEPIGQGGSGENGEFILSLYRLCASLAVFLLKTQYKLLSADYQCDQCDACNYHDKFAPY